MNGIKFKKEIIKNAIKIINKKNTFFMNVYNFFKYILSLLNIRNLWCKKIRFDATEVQYNNKNYKSSKYVQMIVKDNCITLNGFIIPYEYIINIKKIKTKMCNLYTISFLGNFIIDDKFLKISLGSDNVKFIFYTDSKYNLAKVLTNNLYYHIKYGSINEDVIFDLNKKTL